MPLKLTNVYVVDGIKVRLFSTRWGYKRDSISTQLDPQLRINLPSGETVPFADEGAHYTLATLPPSDAAMMVNDSLDQGQADLWHARIGHFGLKRISNKA